MHQLMDESQTWFFCRSGTVFKSFSPESWREQNAAHTLILRVQLKLDNVQLAVLHHLSFLLPDLPFQLQRNWLSIKGAVKGLVHFAEAVPLMEVPVTCVGLQGLCDLPHQIRVCHHMLCWAARNNTIVRQDSAGSHGDHLVHRVVVSR